MKILYCRVGWMNSYNGINNDSLKNGGSYNKNNIGHEIYNFASYAGKYYGYVQPVSGTINIDNITNQKESDNIDDVLVIWVATKDRYGQVIVGWYKNATVYRHYMKVPDVVLNERDETFWDYSISSENATLVPVDKRIMKIVGMGQSNVWYGNDEVNESVLKYIDHFETERSIEIEKIDNTKILEGYEKEVISKVRINQSDFRNRLLKKYKHCLLCGITNENLLLASHIKPWNKSDKNEKTNECNGLLLCAMHDKLFDLGLISFDDEGKILISSKLSETDRILSNVNKNKSIDLEIDNIPFIKYHRENIFKA